MLAPRVAGARPAPDAAACGRARREGRRGAPRLDALLSPGRDFGPRRRRPHAVHRFDRGRPGRRPLHDRRIAGVLIVMRHGATEQEIQRVVGVIQDLGYEARLMPGAQRTAVGLVGNDGRVDASRLEGLPGVQEVIHVSKPYKQVSREWKSENTVVRLPGGVAVGGTDVVAIAGPCSVESERQILEAARQVREAGAVILRGGAWKPRTSPYAVHGLRPPRPPPPPH